MDIKIKYYNEDTWSFLKGYLVKHQESELRISRTVKDEILIEGKLKPIMTIGSELKIKGILFSWIIPTD